ncbi:hypothetical protein [Hymenobacter sp. YC55]|uniref:hypothetical protein n=1 Tax=Hymenobacter sp. YC55 TaxID=3034019 RepID=UPI0023F61EA9|nr:hypothetical protein [Hymenobacter sp. YC55]MDF7809946.1 hypothetical protein [Hymenobacter sp. YC55]
MDTFEKTSDSKIKNKVESYDIAHSEKSTPAPMQVSRPATAAEAVAAKNAADAAAGVVYLSDLQRELIMLLLNNSVVSRSAKLSYLLNINRVTRERAEISITRLIKTITELKGDLPADLAERRAAIAAEVAQPVESAAA